MIYTRILLDDDEVETLCGTVECALSKGLDVELEGKLTHLLHQLTNALQQTQRIRENEKAGVK